MELIYGMAFAKASDELLPPVSTPSLFRVLHFSLAKKIPVL